MLPAGVLGARAGRFGFGAEARDFFALGIDCWLDALRFAARLIALVRGRDERFFRFHLLRAGGGDLRFSGGDLLVETGQLALLRGCELFEARGFGLVLAKLALERQRTGLALASAGNHAAVIAGAVRRQKIAVRILVGHVLGDGRPIRRYRRCAAS